MTCFQWGPTYFLNRFFDFSALTLSMAKLWYWAIGTHPYLAPLRSDDRLLTVRVLGANSSEEATSLQVQ